MTALVLPPVLRGELASQPLKVPRPLVFWVSDANPGAHAAALDLCRGITAAAARQRIENI